MIVIVDYGFGNKINLSSALDNDYINCMNGYITVSPVSMHVHKESNFEKLKKVQF